MGIRSAGAGFGPYLMPRLLFGPFEPDKPPFLSKGLQIASNVYAGSLGYRPVGALVTLTSALPSKPLGAASFVSPQGATSILAGTASKLYRSLPTGWNQIGTGYTLQNDARWRFAQFGGLAIATNGSDPMQKIDLASFAVANLGGSPPTLKMLVVVKDFLVGGVTNGEVNTLRWSAINNAEGWTIGLDQSDYQIMPDGGEITGLLGGEVGIVLQRGRISRMTYVGNNLVFQFDTISYNVGCVSVHSVVQAGQVGFFLSDTGFQMWTGAELKPIGQERVDRTFAASYGRADWPNMSTAVDVRNSLVCWSMADRMFVYNWVLDRWSIIDQPAHIVFSGFSRDLTLEEIGALYGSLEMVPYSLDDDRFKGGNPLFYVFSTADQMATFSGPAMLASLSLGDLELAAGRESRIQTVRPLTDATNGITLTLGTRTRLGDTAAATDYTYLSDNGDMPVRQTGRYVRPELEIAAGTAWQYVQGFDVTLAAGGRR